MVISIAGYFEVANLDLSQLDCAATLSLEDEGRPRADLCCTLRDDLFYFPSIDWLGGPHDGFCHATSLSAYVWLRLPIVKFPKERAALWQSALSLGLLEIVTGMKISEDLIISRRPDGKHVLTSRSVSAVVSHWLFRTTPIHDAAIVSQRRNHAQSMLKWAREAIREARPGEEGAIFADAELDATNVEDILATLTLLTRQLMIIFPCDFEIGSQEHSHFAEEFCSLLEPGNVASRKHMKEKGWCPAIVTSVDPEVIPYASHVVPFSRSPTEHASCSEQNCTTQNPDTAAYTTQHAPTCSDSSCSFLLPSFADVKNLLSLEEIPVIVYDGGTQLMVHSATAGPYVAISHVWADGYYGEGTSHLSDFTHDDLRPPAQPEGSILGRRPLRPRREVTSKEGDQSHGKDIRMRGGCHCLRCGNPLPLHFHHSGQRNHRAYTDFWLDAPFVDPARGIARQGTPL